MTVLFTAKNHKIYKVSKIRIPQYCYIDLLKNHREDCANKCTNKITKT